MSKSGSFADKLDYKTATIAINTTTSAAIDCGGMSLVALVTPSAMTSVAITLLASHDGTTYAPVYNADGTQVSATIPTNATRYVAFTPSDFVMFKWLKLVCGSTETSARSITCVLRAI